ncbi:3-deoxy-7-phosphoheptulonate synthase [Saccharothrix sp. HUAS TT1]|uniref:3-deoxy-7-phosphoheptulonate synthase n=1 Tax=unclassified Saccharothrix TaxID=2593673 RepID=UPI00345B6ABB
MSRTACAEETDLVRNALTSRHGAVHPVRLDGKWVFVCPGAADARSGVEGRSGVHRVIRTGGPFHLAARALHPAGSVVRVGNALIGGLDFTVVAGPCAVETDEQLDESARAVVAAGAALLRGGAYKPRTSPYAFQGLGVAGLRMLARQRAVSGVGVVTEATQPAEVAEVARWADMIQVGTRNMQNFALLKEAGRSGLPVLLKRGMAATVEEWLCAAEYVLNEGNPDVVLCERGIRAFGRETRFSLDLSIVPVVKRLSHLPVIVDPSHSTGDPALVAPMALAAAAAGADGVIVDVHADPAAALCDGGQALRPEEFKDLVGSLEPVVAAVGRSLARADARPEPLLL